MKPIINNEQHRNKIILFLEKLIMFASTLLLWYLVLQHIFYKLVLENYLKTIEATKFLGLISLIIFLLLAAWQEYNIYKYRSFDQRKSRIFATDDFVAHKFNIATESLYQLRSARYLDVCRDGNISYYSGENIAGKVSMHITGK